MGNLKVKVNSVEESKEVQDLFFELGGVAHDDNQNRVGLVIFANNIIYVDFFHFEDHYTKTYSAKEITIPQLKDMVVLKRNDVRDATHEYCKGFGDNLKYREFDDGWYYFGCNGWDKSSNTNHDKLKPIQDNDLPFIDSEEDMREFLDYQGGWSYKLITSSVDGCVDRDWIEVPEGACSLTTCDDKLLFWNHDETMCMNPKIESSFRWVNCSGHAEYFKMNSHTMNKLVLWRRNPQEESINDKVVSADGWGQKHSHYKKDVSHLEFIDVYRVLDLFEVESHAVGHAIKKLLCSGQRGAKDKAQDIQEAIDSLNRELEMMKENESSKD